MGKIILIFWKFCMEKARMSKEIIKPNTTAYPFVVSVGALELISTLGLSYEEVLSIPREFNAGGCHTFLLRSDITASMNDVKPGKRKVNEDKKVEQSLVFNSKPKNWGKKKYGSDKRVKFYLG